MYYKRHNVFLFLILILLITVGCQQTPDEPVVVNKGGDSLESIINSSSISASPDISQPAKQEDRKWEDMFSSTDGTTNIIVDAVVNIPDAKKYPVLSVEPGSFSIEQIKTAANALFDGAGIYSGKDVMTKSMIEERIIKIEKSISEYESNNKDGEFDYIIGQYKKSIEHFQELYKTAADELPKNPPNYEYKDSMVNLYSDMGGKEMRYIDVFDLSDRDRELLFTTSREYVITDEAIQPGVDINKELSYSEAKETADRYLNEIGVDYMDVSYSLAGRKAISSDDDSDVSEIVKAGEYGTTPKYTKEPIAISKYDESVEPCYVFYYTRCVNGILTTYVNEHNGTSVMGVDGDKTYREPWEQEHIEVLVDKDGIASLTWDSPTKVNGFESQNVPVILLDEAKETAKKDLQIIYNKFVINKNVTMHITNVVLGMTRIAVEGEKNKYIFVPSWDFFGYYEYPLSSTNEYISDKSAYTLLTLNAIDGSIIDRGVEY